MHRRRIRKYRKISIIPIFAAAHHHDQMIKDSLWHYFSFYFIRDSFILSFPNIPIPSVQDLPPSPPANLIKACANNISPSGWCRDLFGQRLNATTPSGWLCAWTSAREYLETECSYHTQHLLYKSEYWIRDRAKLITALFIEKYLIIQQ